MKKLYVTVLLVIVNIIFLSGAKISPLLRAGLCSRSKTETSLTKITPVAMRDGKIPVIIKFKEGYIPRVNNIQTISGNVATAFITEEELSKLENDENILIIDGAIILNTFLNVSTPATKADLLRYGPAPVYDDSSFTGKGVVLGVVDTGIDWSMDDFKDAIGNSRIAYLWDQTNNSTGTPPSGYTYGAEWTNTQIDAGQCDEEDDPNNVCHGTHVCGIAAGDGASTGNGVPAYTYTGVAPEATIIFVKTDLMDNSIIDGVNYIFQKADQLSMPASVNLSLGGNTGPHDGTTSFELAMNSFTGPGKIITAAAGNSGADSIHSAVTVPNGSDIDIHFRTEDWLMSLFIGVFPVIIDIWHNGSDDFTITVISPDGGTVYGPVSAGDSAVSSLPDGNGTAYIYGDILDPNNGDKEMAVIFDVTSIPFLGGGYTGNWTIRLHANSSSGNTTHLWSAIVYSASMVDNVDMNMTIAMPATADSIISVAAYVTKKEWIDETGTQQSYSGITQGIWDPTIGAIADFSAAGPRRDGIIKPDIAAPGMGIASTRASNATMNPITGGSDIEKATEQDGKHYIMQGTSQACPHVAGAIAMILEVSPNFNPSEIRDILTSSAVVDGFVGSTPNNRWGSGKMDIYNAIVNYAQGIKSKPLLRKRENIRCFVKNDILFISGINEIMPDVSVMNIAGRVVKSAKYKENGLDIGNMIRGVYFVNIKGVNYTVTRKINLIR